jgi:tetratricopeptide (TPR) repeat protein
VVRVVVVGATIVATTAGLLSPWASFLHQDQSRHYRFGLGLDNLSAPIATVDLLEAWELPGPIYNSWGFGGYLMWRVWPRLRVFGDGRDYMYVDLYEELHQSRFDQVLSRRGIKTLLIAHEDRVALHLMHRSPEFVLMAFDDRAQLWTDRKVAAGLPGLRPLDLMRPEDLSLGDFDSLSFEDQARVEQSALLAVERSPGHARPWAMLGQVQRRRGDLDRAIDSYERAVRLDPGQASYENNLGACLLDLGRIEEATAKFRRACRLDPEMYSAHLNLGKAFLMGGDPVAAVTALSRARELDSEGAEPLYLLGRAATDPEESEAFLRMYLEKAPRGPWADDARARLSSN